jgi:hypothetical protein
MKTEVIKHLVYEPLRSFKIHEVAKVNIKLYLCLIK